MSDTQNNLVVPDVANFSSMMERLASNKDVDVEKLERMMTMNERILDREAQHAFSADFVRMKPHLPKVLKTKENSQTQSKYAPLEEINTQIDPILEQFGFGTSTSVKSQTETSVSVEAALWHRDGHKETTLVTMPLDNVGAKGTVNKTNVHATASSITYAKRVALCALLNISTGDDTDGNVVSEIIDTEQAAAIDTLVRATGTDLKAFLSYFKVPDIRQLKVNQYQQAINLLNKKTKKEKAA